MAAKIEATQAPPKEVMETSDTEPLLDLPDAAVKKLIRTAKKRGYVTHDQVKSLSEEVSSEQIEDVLTMFSEMGVNVVETVEAADDEEKEREEADDEPEPEGGELVEVQQKVPAKSEAKEPAERTTDPGAHVSARNGRGRAALARGRNRHRQAHRGRPRGDDRRSVREPADLPGHHHLARGAQRRKGVPARHHRSRSHLCGPRRQERADDGDRPRRPAGGAAARRRRQRPERTGADAGSAGRARDRDPVQGGDRRHG